MTCMLGYYYIFSGAFYVIEIMTCLTFCHVPCQSSLVADFAALWHSSSAAFSSLNICLETS